MRPEDDIAQVVAGHLAARGLVAVPAVSAREVREAIQFALFLHLGNDAGFSDLQYVANDVLGRLAAMGLLGDDPDL